MKILIGMSGGLDSTYAAYLLGQQGHEVVGASLVMHSFTETKKAEEAARAVGIPFVPIGCEEIFKDKVIGDFISEYCHGRTPNPCVVCNRFVKIAALCDYAEKNSFDAVSTGHYSSVPYENGRYFIRRASDEAKDQSYVLWKLTQKQLPMLYLPLAGMKKADIREKAAALGFKAAESPESQEICFIPDDDYVGYIENECKRAFPEGNFIDREGNILGRHRGIVRYTVGQRKGLGISLGQPMFVTSLNAADNTVTLAPAGGEFSEKMIVSELNFMKLGEPPSPISAMVKVRYSARPVACRVTFHDEKAEVCFDSPVRAVTPGQSAVFYEGGDLLFGGVIDSAT